MQVSATCIAMMRELESRTLLKSQHPNSNANYLADGVELSTKQGWLKTTAEFSNLVVVVTALMRAGRTC